MDAQVPKQIMVAVQETVMVPQVRTKMVPKMTTETKAVTVQKPVQTVQTMVRTVNKVIEGQKIVQSHQVIEYERPKMIQGRFLGKQQAGITEVGVQWTGQYYQKGAQVIAKRFDVSEITPCSDDFERLSFCARRCYFIFALGGVILRGAFSSPIR